MKKIPYLKYFLFIARYWNIGLAWFTVSHEIRGEKKYNIDTIAIDRLRNLQVIGDNKPNASIYQGANYYILEKAFDYLIEQNAQGTVVDFGSGKGRILAVAAHYGFTNIKGIEFAPVLADLSHKNIHKIKKKYPQASFTILQKDALTYHVEPEDTIFTFFNPFNEIVLLEVIKNILTSFKRSPRKIFVVYINPIYKEIFQSAGFFEEYYLCEMEYLELSILTILPDEP